MKIKGLLFTIMGLLIAASVSATTKTLNIYKTNHEVLRFDLSLIDSVSIDETNNWLYVYKNDGTTNAVPLNEVERMDYSSGEYELPTIETVSAQYEFKLEKAICEADISDDGGNPIFERGFCWSTSPDPTVLDNKFASGSTTGKFYSSLSGLDMGTTYYVRAYASNGMGTSYGKTIKLNAMMGNVTYTLGVDSAKYPEYYNLLKTALDEACYYYSRYTEFKANIWVYYNAGIPTAQASYHGSIGFGSSTNYMWVGTVMHEMAHFFGSGTSNQYRTLMDGGVWKGHVAQALCQELTGTQLKGDQVHFWPLGINYRDEVKSKTDLINHAKLVQAMLVEDCGLPTSW
jgi:hypothetical protein